MFCLNLSQLVTNEEYNLPKTVNPFVIPVQIRYYALIQQKGTTIYF